MMVTFMDEHWKAGKSSTEAALVGRERTPAADLDDGLRDDRRHGADGAGAGARKPDGGPLGRAVIGGLVMSTFATLLVLPSIFALVIGRQGAQLALALSGQPRAARITTRDSPECHGGSEAGRASATAIHRYTLRETCVAIRRNRTEDRIGLLPRGRRSGFWLLALLAGDRAARRDKKVAPSVSEPPVLQLIHPQRRKIIRIVGQPSFVQSYERTSIYPKLTAYIEKWNVDIGDKVRKGRRARGSVRARAARGVGDEEGDRGISTTKKSGWL